MNCFRLQGQTFQPAEDPIDAVDGDYIQNIFNAGYSRDLTSRTDEDWDPEITLYSTQDETKPRYYIDVSGRNGQIAVLLADDFPGLIAVLKEIGPLIALFAIEQRAQIFSSVSLANHPAG
jgi:hypothetical protein